MHAVYLDDVPVLFGDEPPAQREWLAPLGDRVRRADYDGEFPLTGEVLETSLALLDAEITPLIPESYRH